jgi:hypothetical protein
LPSWVISAALGSLPLPLLRLGSIVLHASFGSADVVLLWYGLYTFLVASTAYYRLAGINMKY